MPGHYVLSGPAGRAGGADLDLAWEGAGHTKVAIGPNTLTMNNKGVLWAFTR